MQAANDFLPLWINLLILMLLSFLSGESGSAVANQQQPD
jgi:hypothetical protein